MPTTSLSLVSKLTILTLLGSVLVGCVTTSTRTPASRPLALGSGSDGAPPPQEVDYFAYPRTEVPFRNAVLHKEERARYTVRHIRFPSIGDNGQQGSLVTGKYYESKLAGRWPVAIVLPIWGGHVYPTERISRMLRRKSNGRLNIFEVNGEGHIYDWDAMATASDPDTLVELFRIGAERERVIVQDIRRTLDWAEARPEVDPDRFALIGFSHSAVAAAATAPHEPRLAATVVVMGGALVHEVLAICPLERSEGMRARAEELGWDTATLAEQIAPHFRSLDPATYPGRADPSTILLVEAARDECMPQTGRVALFEALGRPERITIDARHHRAFLAMTPLGLYSLRWDIWEFLDRKLAISAGAAPPSVEEDA